MNQTLAWILKYWVGLYRSDQLISYLNVFRLDWTVIMRFELFSSIWCFIKTKILEIYQHVLHISHATKKHGILVAISRFYMFFIALLSIKLILYIYIYNYLIIANNWIFWEYFLLTRCLRYLGRGDLSTLPLPSIKLAHFIPSYLNKRNHTVEHTHNWCPYKYRATFTRKVLSDKQCPCRLGNTR